MRIVRQGGRNLKHDAITALIARCDTTDGRRAVASMVSFGEATALLRYPTGFALILLGGEARYVGRAREFIEVIAFVVELSDSAELWLAGLDESEARVVRVFVKNINAGAARLRRAAHADVGRTASRVKVCNVGLPALV